MVPLLVIVGVVLALGAGATPVRAADAADGVAPRGSVAGVHSPVRGTLALEVNASDDGVGLARAWALVDGVARATVALDPRCADPAVAPPPDGCVREVARVALTVDASGLALGPHHLQVRVTDAAGNEADVYAATITVAGPDPVWTSTVQLTVGDPHAPLRPTGGAVLGTRATPPCALPRLSVVLDQRPLRVVRGRPVLRAHARYRFRGTLTCRVGTVRRRAPRGTAIEVLNRVGRRTFGVTGATTTSRGRFTLILAYRSSRTLIFRHRASTGMSQVRIPITVR